MQREFSDGLVCQPQTLGLHTLSQPLLSGHLQQTQCSSPHSMKGEKSHFSMKQAGVVGPGHLGCHVQGRPGLQDREVG